jgi:hypothetical protein
VILETIDAKHPQAVSFRLTGGLAATEVHVWETNNTHIFEQVALLRPVDGAFQYTFEPESLYSLTTTTGQGKGDAQPPPAAAFPFPYADNFEETPVNHTPKYLSDQDGAFEVKRCHARAGQCLEQVISEKPIPWGPLPDPFTLAGNADWTDYSVAADVYFLTSSPATLMGRIDSADVFQDGKARWPSGYILRVQPDGAWQLFSAEFKKPVTSLAYGSVPIDRNRWHHLEMRFRGNRILASLDGIALASVENSAHTHGMIALGTEWDHVQFDELSIKP